MRSDLPLSQYFALLCEQGEPHMKTDYIEILKKHPSTITLDQFYRICHFSKRKAKWLLENGYVPCQDSHKKTRRFKIKTVDAVYYLQQLEENPAKWQPPAGIFSSHYVKHRNDHLGLVTVNNINDFKAYLILLWESVPDILTIHTIHELTGYLPTTISHWISEKKMKSITVLSKRVVAKDWLIEFLCEYTLTHPGYFSEMHRNIVSSFIRSDSERMQKESNTQK